jgi:hypothetical protein
VRVKRSDRRLDVGNAVGGTAKRHKVSRRRSRHSDLCGQTLEVLDVLQHGTQPVALDARRAQRADRVQASFDRVATDRRSEQHLFEQPPAHVRARLVDDRKQRMPARTVGSCDQLEVPHRRSIEHHCVRLLVERDFGDVRECVALRIARVVEKPARRGRSQRAPLQSKAVEARNAEMRSEQRLRVIQRVHPLVERRHGTIEPETARDLLER